jgi:hypothetical protein
MVALKRRYRFLYLAIACIAGLIAVFVVDGYMGIYDTIYVTVGEREEKIEASWWQQPESAWPTRYENAWTTWATVGQKITFRYEIENHQFSTYLTPVQASVWQENEKVDDLFSGDISIGQFGKETVEWSLATEELPGLTPGWPAQYTVKINRGDIERKIILDLNYPEAPPIEKPVPESELQR